MRTRGRGHITALKSLPWLQSSHTWACQAASCLRSTHGGAALWTTPARADAGLCSWVRNLMGQGDLCGGELPALLLPDPSQWDWPCKGSFFLILDLCAQPSWVTSGEPVHLHVFVHLCVCIHVGGWEGTKLYEIHCHLSEWLNI